MSDLWANLIAAYAVGAVVMGICVAYEQPEAGDSYEHDMNVAVSIVTGVLWPLTLVLWLGVWLMRD